MCEQCWDEDEADVEDEVNFICGCCDTIGIEYCDCAECMQSHDSFYHPEPIEPEPVKARSFIQESAGVLCKVLAGKNEDYKVDTEFSNFERAAEFAATSPFGVMMAQIAIKYTRIQGMREESAYNYESLKDSLMDLAGYAIIAHAYLSKDD